MRILIVSIFTLVWLVSCGPEKEYYMFTSFKEPADEGLYYLYSEDGLNWTRIEKVFLKPEIGKQKVMRDASMVHGPEGTYHMVWTTSWRGDLGFGYAHTKDLIHWSEQQLIPVMEFDTSTVNVWAPELFYDDVDDRFIIIWASTIPFKFEKGEEEEKNNHRMYFTTTRDFKTFTETKLFLDPGFSVIDAVIVKRSDEDYVLVLKDNTRPNRNMKVAFSDNPLGPWEDVSEPFTGFLTEGPTVVRLGEEYVIYYDEYRTKTYGAQKTTDFKSFQDITSEISVPEGHKHGTIFKAKESLVKGLSNELNK
ncbi:glycoside hydrolase family 43 protein [Marinoscillum sp. MHG1-6]|uniref:glycoside hydrolase family 43 protein n=1 Tax=Marinoscillum sp. MHG1-6 TaxID=2959627 RepID=UPI0021576257|nr:glycoside hydrolase family 43 protein [Marinoscillum sp. MHG1-6]